MKITTGGKILRDGKVICLDDKKKKIIQKLFPIQFPNLFKIIKVLGLKTQNGLTIELTLLFTKDCM